MALLVQKFGGTSVADAGRLRAVAGHVAATVAAGNHVVVVVSAMGRSTDDLLALAQEVSVTPLARELDVVATAGERISMALLCMALADLGQPARSFTGQAAGILTDSNFGRAAIVDIDPKAVLAALEAGEVAVVAGFQGASAEGELTALGRGGSDTTAVALAAALGADSCEIYTDVTGVFTADPRVVPRARRLDSVSYEEMLEMAATGGKVLALRSVEFARNHGVEVHVRSSFTWEPGTWVANPASNASSALTMNACPRGSESEASLARPQDEASPFARVEDENAASGGSGRSNAAMVCGQGTRTRPGGRGANLKGTTDLEGAAPKGAVLMGTGLMGGGSEGGGSEGGGSMGGGSEGVALERAVVSAITSDRSEAKVTVVGVPDQPGVAARLFRALAEASVNVDMIVQNVSLSGVTEISFTVPQIELVTAERVTRAVAGTIGAREVTSDAGIGRVSLVGGGMKTHPGVAATVFEVMAEAGINIEMISTSSIRISCVVRVDSLDRAVRALHQAFDLHALPGAS